MTSTYSLPAAQTEGNKWTHTLFNLLRDCIDFLRNPPRYVYSRGTGVADYTTAATTFGDIDATNMNQTIAVQGTLVRVTFSGYITGIAAFFDILVNGASISGNTTGVGQWAINTAVTIVKYITVTPGNNTFKMQWRVASGTATLQSEQVTQFIVEEI